MSMATMMMMNRPDDSSKPLVEDTTDEESVDSLLSDWNSDSDEEEGEDEEEEEDTTSNKKMKISNNHDTIRAESVSSGDGSTASYEQLQQRFALRESLLNRMCKGKDESFAAMLIHHEELVQAEAFRQLLKQEAREEEQNCDSNCFLSSSNDNESEATATNAASMRPSIDMNLKNTAKFKSKTKAKAKPQNYTANKKEEKLHTLPPQIVIQTSEPSSASSLRNMLLFEARLTLPGLAGLALYCSMQMAAFEATQCMVMELNRIVKDEVAFHAIFCIIVPLLVVRLTGGVFDWVSVERHEMAKFELHNRIRLGCLDAKVHLWFRKRKKLKFWVDNIAIYACLVGVGYFHERLLEPFFTNRDWLVDNLPSREHGMETPIYWWLKGRFTPECDAEVEDDQCTWLEEMTDADEQYVLSEIAIVSSQQIFGDEMLAGLTPWGHQVLHVCMAGINVLLLTKLGYTWD